MEKLLVIAQQWPEPDTNAAGLRMEQLLYFFKKRYEVHLACAIEKTCFSHSIKGVQEHAIVLNDSSFQDFVKKLNPCIVVYDRFIIEEQFGWRFRESCPSALQILNTEDLHFLRKARRAVYLNGGTITDYLRNNYVMRELGAIYRCDLSLIISKFEHDFLMTEFNMSDKLLHYLPLCIPSQKFSETFHKQRKDFMYIGNFNHPPNKDGFVFLMERIWPDIYEQLPHTQLHIYGAYMSDHLKSKYSKVPGVVIHGYIENVHAVMQQHQLLLAPVTYGAGLKGKVLTAMANGLPMVLSEVAAEGIFNLNEDFVTEISSPLTFVQKAVRIYKDKNVQNQIAQIGFETLANSFDFTNHFALFENRLKSKRTQLTADRLDNIVGSILSHDQHKAVKYFSLWIEEKNKNTK